ncbi:hypothetical protein V5O48_001330 [Marasmius crinis-equi]|uniref:Heterokaryon incompatibility Het-C n=1 Tax=Marasmius crinis-equi TaxID=585013 RepID=A0ABR3FYR2_9AGAR
MAFTPNLTTTFLILAVIVIVLPTETYAFGAGDIPDFAYLNDKAYRHGDIENVLAELVKSAGGAAAGGGLLGFAKKVLDKSSGGSKFDRSDIKRVYFGNWLRDYSQAMDIAGLTKLSADTLILILSVLGFMTFGYATEEFEVTADRVGVYLPVEHIDNPKGYGGDEDARKYHPKLRPPVDSRELEIDERTGMKKYMATENEGFDTSTAHIRRILRGCIEHGRRAGGQEGADLWEAYRLMGTGLHTLEDLLAHSNWCEIGLRKMGHSEVFCHVGEETDINTPNGPAPPLVTGTFGSADFMHSMLGEATDHISQASVTALADKMDESKSSDAGSKISQIKELLGKFNIGGDTNEKLDQGEQLQQQSQAYNFNPDDVAPPEVQKQLLDLLKWRDGVFRDITKKIDMIPGLADLVDELTNALNAYVYTVLAPWLTPILKQATDALGEGSKAVIDSDDQYEVFNNPRASDPSHSILSKDHFNLILNEPAGKIAKIVVTHAVQLIVPAWSDDSDPDQIINSILEAFHHPYYADGNSRIQHEMFEELQKWFGALGPDVGGQTIQALTKDSVREGKNKRFSDESEGMVEPGYGGGHSHGGSGGGYGGSSGGGGGGYQQQMAARVMVALTLTGTSPRAVTALVDATRIMNMALDAIMNTAAVRTPMARAGATKSLLTVVVMTPTVLAGARTNLRTATTPMRLAGVMKILLMVAAMTRTDQVDARRSPMVVAMTLMVLAGATKKVHTVAAKTPTAQGGDTRSPPTARVGDVTKSLLTAEVTTPTAPDATNLRTVVMMILMAPDAMSSPMAPLMVVRKSLMVPAAIMKNLPMVAVMILMVQAGATVRKHTVVESLVVTKILMGAPNVVTKEDINRRMEAGTRALSRRAVDMAVREDSVAATTMTIVVAVIIPATKVVKARPSALKGSTFVMMASAKANTDLADMGAGGMSTTVDIKRKSRRTEEIEETKGLSRSNR